MKLSILVATLGAVQINGAVGSKEAREQLRRNLRQNGRRAQFNFIPETPDVPTMAPTEEDMGDKVDDFFKDTEFGTVYDWDAKAEEEAIEFYASEDASKSTKLGKSMWEEKAVYGKASKSGKGSKSSKKSAIYKKGAKGALLGLPKTYEAVVEDDVVEDEETVESWLDSFAAEGGMTYSDLFSAATGKEETEETEIMGRMEGGVYTYDDDYFNYEEPVFFLPRPTVTLGGSLFSVNPQTTVPPVVPDGSGDTLTIGTEYLFNEITFNAQNIDSRITPIDVDSEQVSFVVALDGYCDRIGPADQNSVQGYCFFTYTFIDPFTSLTAGSFTAQGIIVNSQVPGQLTVTGGTGILTGATGLVEVLPAAVDNDVDPPELVQPAAGLDPFNGVAGWAHFFEFDVDVLFFIPELYADRR